jgi:hypothetical protein
MKLTGLHRIAGSAALLSIWVAGRPAQTAGPQTVVVRPKQIDDVLINPGIGFMTFGRGRQNAGPT